MEIGGASVSVKKRVDAINLYLPKLRPIMCRWFTYLGDEPQLLEDVLLRPTHSIVKQSAPVPQFP